jgi:hypothetical protein
MKRPTGRMPSEYRAWLSAIDQEIADHEAAVERDRQTSSTKPAITPHTTGLENAGEADLTPDRPSGRPRHR